MSRWILLLPALLAPACQSGPDAEKAMLERMARDHEQYLAVHEAAQADVLRRWPMPQRHDFGPDGTILVDDFRLEGRPGKEYLRVHFTWVNTTGRAVRKARVSLVIEDPGSDEAWTQSMDLILPFTFELTPDSSYTSWFELETHGLHLRPGWTWALEAETFAARRP